MVVSRTVALVLASLLTALLVGCGSADDSDDGSDGSDSAASTDDTADAVRLPDCVGEGTHFEHTVGEETTPGVILGDGPVGVVVSYEDRGNVCSWMPLAEPLLEAGHRVLLYDRNDTEHPERDIVAMAERLREEGAETIFLVGGSMGGRLSPLAASLLDQPVAGVVNISGLVTAQHARTLRVPFLQIVGSGDELAPVAKMRAADRAVSKSPDHRLVVVDDPEHASWLFEGPAADRVLRTIVQFVDRHA